MILAGGGDPHDSKLLDRFYNHTLSRKRLLFLPQAVAPKTWSYDRAYFWLRKNKALHGVKIRMWKSLAGKSFDDLLEFDTIYIMGGNTFELLYQLRKTGFITHLQRFIEIGRVVYGISAGAMILGRDIVLAHLGSEADKNKVGLKDLQGLNLLGGYNVHPHYVKNDDNELFRRLRRMRVPFFAIPEKSGLYVRNRFIRAIGYDPVYIFQKGIKTRFDPGSSFRLPTRARD